MQDELFKRIKQVQLCESVEQIDELKASTLGSYIGKAHGDVNKMKEKENETKEQIKKETGWKHFGVYDPKRMSRQRGVKTAIDKLSKGDFQESIQNLADIIDMLDEEQLEAIASVVVEMLDEGEDSYTKNLERAHKELKSRMKKGIPKNELDYHISSLADKHDVEEDDLRNHFRAGIKK